MFLTRLRLPMRESAGMPALKRASRMFAVVGLFVGLAGGIVYAIAIELGFASWLAATLAVGSTILLTGGLHEDGLADTADGFAGGGTRDEKLAIMRDSRIGSFGTLALIFSVLFRVAALASLTDIGIVMAALIAGHAASRAAMTAVMHALPNARSDGLSAGVGRPTAWPPASPRRRRCRCPGAAARRGAAGHYHRGRSRGGYRLAGAAADRRPDRRCAGRH
jgi:adenosylcobinamide-GDP ribazoletransferase